MIVVDTSALIAIALSERDATRFAQALAGDVAIVGTATLVETEMVLRGRLSNVADQFVEKLIEERGVIPEPFSLEMYRAARTAFVRYGKGMGHPARLNFGDCLSYAVAKVHGLPLLYKGLDFAQTDIVPALSP